MVTWAIYHYSTFPGLLMSFDSLQFSAILKPNFMCLGYSSQGLSGEVNIVPEANANWLSITCLLEATGLNEL